MTYPPDAGCLLAGRAAMTAAGLASLAQRRLLTATDLSQVYRRRSDV
jgi:hypothetical protein